MEDAATARELTLHRVRGVSYKTDMRVESGQVRLNLPTHGREVLLVGAEAAGFDPVSAETATALAHLMAAKAVLDSGVEWAIVAEDDASFDIECLWSVTDQHDEGRDGRLRLDVDGFQDDAIDRYARVGLAEVMKQLPQDWELLNLYGFHIEMESALVMRDALSRGILLHSFKQSPICDNCLWGGVAYCLHRRGAQAIVDKHWKDPYIIDVTSGVPSEMLMRAAREMYFTNRPLVGMGSADQEPVQSLTHSGHEYLHWESHSRSLRFFMDPSLPFSAPCFTLYDAFAYYHAPQNLPNYLLLSFLVPLTWVVVGLVRELGSQPQGEVRRQRQGAAGTSLWGKFKV